MKVEKGYFYTDNHEWVSVDGNVVTLGISDYAQDHMGDIVYVELPDEGDELDAGDAFASVESVKAASDFETPFAGTVVEVNEDVDDEPEDVNEDPYGMWMVKIEVEGDIDTSSLKSDSDYEDEIGDLEYTD